MSLVFHSYATRMYLYVICMTLVCTRMPSVCHSYVLVSHPYVTRMYSYVIRMSLVCTRMSSVSHSYVTRMYSYVICISLVCTRMSSVCHSYVILMSLVCGFTMSCFCLHNLAKYFLLRFDFYDLTEKTDNFYDLTSELTAFLLEIQENNYL